MIVNGKASGRRRAPRVRVPQVAIPEPANGLDRVVNALAEAWNEQGRDPDAYRFFDTWVAGERHDLIARSVYRFTDERDQQFIARWLVELARAIEGGAFRWTARR